MYIIAKSGLAIFAVAAQVMAATPPACLIAALGAQPNPADLRSLCGTLSMPMIGNITNSCAGGMSASALNVYSATCLAQGVTIALPTATSSGGLLATGTGRVATATTPSATLGVAASGALNTLTVSVTMGSPSAASSTKASGASILSPQDVVFACGIVFLGVTLQ